MDKLSCLSAVFVILATNVGILSLRLVGIDVPAAVKFGDPVWLNCTLDYESDNVYSVKWYKDDVEFYRYLPGDKEPDQIYDLKGVYVDLSKSSEGQVYLNTTDNNTDGIFRCEASAEGPLFQTVDAMKELTVYALPEDPPTMLESASFFEIGQVINATCISDPSKPAANLTWYINGEPAPKRFQTSRPTEKLPSGLESSSLLLSFEVTEEHSPDGRSSLSLRCESSVSEKHSTKSAILVIGDKKPHTEPPERTEMNDTTPVITGMESSYRTGDPLNINCTSAKALPAPKLRWFINYGKAPFENLVPYSPIVDEDGLETSILGLRLIVKRDYFDPTDVMKLKCTSTLSRVVDTKSVEKVIENSKEGGKPWVAENRDAGSFTGKANGAQQQTMTDWSLILLTLIPFL